MRRLPTPLSPVLRAPAALVNRYSSGSVSTLGVANHAAKETLSGALTSATLATVLSVTGTGVLEYLSAYAMDATARTVRLQVTIDGVVVFDATSNSLSATGAGLCAAGHSGRDAGGTNYFNALAAVPFWSSLVVKVASSLSETDKVAVGHVYRTI